MDFEKILTIGAPIIISIFSGLIAYFKAVKVGNLKIKELEQQSQYELEKLKNSHKNELEKLERELDAQAKLYEKNKQTDLISDTLGNFMGPFLQSPAMKEVIEKEFLKAFEEDN